MKIVVLLCLAAFMCLALADPPAIDYFRPDQVLRFADHLYDQGDYLRAAGEFQRYLLSFDSLPVNTDEVYFRIARCYCRTGAYGRAIDYYQRVRDLPDSKLSHEASFQTGFCHYLAAEYDSSWTFLNEHRTEFYECGFRNRFYQLLSVNFMMKGLWDDAREALRGPTGPDSFTDELTAFLSEYKHLSRKSPVLAAGYSAVVPGLGKLYCRRPFDALSSFTSIAILGWQAYDGFHDDGKGSVKGWIFSVVGGIFYLGNIYGSVVAADLYNEEVELRLVKKIQVRVNAHFD